MSDPNVERKKSYRWASASKVSYDGADWDSSDDDAAFDPNSPVDSSNRHGALPSLPKLDYLNEVDEVVVPDKEKDQLQGNEEDEEVEGQHSNDHVSRLEQPVSSENIISPQIVMTPDFNEYSSPNTSTSNHNVNESSLSLRKNSPSRDINEDLDNLMKQISKEMTPQMPSSNGTFQSDNTTNDSINEQFLSARASQSPYLSHERLVDRSNSQQSSITSNVNSISENDEDNQSIDDMHVSRSGYFKEYLQSNERTHDQEEDNHVVPEVPESDLNEEEHDNDDTLSFTNSITYSEGNHNIHNQESSDGDANKKDNDFPYSEDDNITSQDESDGDFKFHNTQTRQSIIESSDDNGNEEDESDDGIIYTNQNDSMSQSIASDKKIEDKTRSDEYNEEVYNNKVAEDMLKSSHDDYDFGSNGSESDNDDESDLKVSKSGYFSKMINQNGQVFSRNEYENEDKPEIHYYKAEDSDLQKTDDDERDSLSIPETIDDDIKGGKPDLDKLGKKEPITSKADGAHQYSDGSEDEDVTSIAKSVGDDTTSFSSSKRGGEEVEHDSTSKSSQSEHQSDKEDDEDNDDVKTTSSWQPDTESSRSGFVQETAKKLTPPPGFVVDENGKLVDLTPSSMKPRVVSTYSEIESGWNVFPSNHGDNEFNDDGADLETVHDTKTLYDNSTIYNVPGLLTNNQNLPPLPGKIDTITVMKNDGTDTGSTSTYHTAIGGATPLSGTSGKSMPTSQYSLNITAPNSKDISRINLNNTMPELNVVKLISSNKPHNMKLQQLNGYYEDLNNYDTGLQTWVRYSLNMPKDDAASLDYKPSKIVRDAYANAEDMSKKHTVSNTVASVNHNVNHLKKKVLQHTIKPKTLFSSIGKGVKL